MHVSCRHLKVSLFCPLTPVCYSASWKSSLDACMPSNYIEKDKEDIYLCTWWCVACSGAANSLYSHHIPVQVHDRSTKPSHCTAPQWFTVDGAMACLLTSENSNVPWLGFDKRIKMLVSGLTTSDMSRSERNPYGRAATGPSPYTKVRTAQPCSHASYTLLFNFHEVLMTGGSSGWREKLQPGRHQIPVRGDQAVPDHHRWTLPPRINAHHKGNPCMATQVWITSSP